VPPAKRANAFRVVLVPVCASVAASLQNLFVFNRVFSEFVTTLASSFGVEAGPFTVR
jgi:hypothetical protein